MKGLLSLVCSVLLSFATLAQFQNLPDLLGEPVLTNGANFGQGVTVYDVNLDGLDDVTVVQSEDSLLVFESTGSGFVLHKTAVCLGQAKQALYGDFDNDGDPDLVITAYLKPLTIYRNDGNWQFNNVTAELGLATLPWAMSFGASWGDINNDGWLDLFVANYDQGPVGSWLFINNQGVSFTNVSNLWGVNIGSDFSFQGTFFDHNEDGLQDLHIANDRFPADALLINYNNQFFLNQASSNGFDVPSDAMCSSVADYNHDGKFDIYVSDTQIGNKLWERNTQGFYTNVAVEKGVVLYRHSWGATWIDANNDSWEDLFVNTLNEPGDNLPFFYNSSGNFEQNDAFDNYFPSYNCSSAKGDFNNDGYPDMAVTAIDEIPVRILLNDGGENHFIKFRLVGQISNKDGVGTHVRYVIDENSSEQLVRYTRAGDNYLSQDSQWYIIGLGSADTLAHLQLNWLSGISDVHTNLVADSVYVFYEGQSELSILSETSQLLSDTITICWNQPLIVSANTNLNVVWSDGNTDHQRVIHEPGSYFYTAVSEFGIETVSNTIVVQLIDEPQLTIALEHPSCFGNTDGNILVDVSDGWGYNAPQDSVYAAGQYALLFTHPNGCVRDTIVELYEPDLLAFSYVQSSLYDSTVAYIISGGTPPYAIVADVFSFDEDSLYFPSGNFLVEIIDANGCAVADSILILQLPQPDIDDGEEEQEEEQEEDDEISAVSALKSNVHLTFINNIPFETLFLPNRIAVFDMLGKCVVDENIEQAAVKLVLPSSTYFVCLSNGMEKKVLKLFFN